MGEEQEEVTDYLGVVLERREAAGGVLSTGAVGDDVLASGETGRRRGGAARAIAHPGGSGARARVAGGRRKSGAGVGGGEHGGRRRHGAKRAWKPRKREGTWRA